MTYYLGRHIVLTDQLQWHCRTAASIQIQVTLSLCASVGSANLHRMISPNLALRTRNRISCDSISCLLRTSHNSHAFLLQPKRNGIIIKDRKFIDWLDNTAFYSYSFTNHAARLGNSLPADIPNSQMISFKKRIKGHCSLSNDKYLYVGMYLINVFIIMYVCEYLF